MPTAVLVLMPPPRKLRLLTTTPAELDMSSPALLPLLIVARFALVPQTPKVIGAPLVPLSVEGITMVPLKVCPAAKRTTSPARNFWLLTRLMVFHAAVMASPVAASEPVLLT